MNLNKSACMRTRKEAVVKFVDDQSVPTVKNIDEFKTKNKNEEGQQSLKSSSKGSASIKKEDKLDVKKIVDSIFNYSDNDDDDDDSSLSGEEKCPVDKPVALFQEGDVPGKAVFGFQTPKRKNAMVDKATESAERITPSNKSKVRSPGTPSSGCKTNGFTAKIKKSIPLKLNATSTPERSCQKEKKIGVEDENVKADFGKTRDAADRVTVERTVPKTPYSLRARLKTKIAAQVKREVEDFSDSEEDFVPSDDDDDDDDDKESCSSDSDTDVKTSLKPAVKNADKKEILKALGNTPLQKQKRRDLTYAITADEYFNSNSGKNNKTSNHTLNRLKNPRLAQDELDKLLYDVNQRCSHQSALEALKEECCTSDLFKKWCFCLREGYSLLLYGLGSKRVILNTFLRHVLSESHVLVINGFFPGLTIKEIIDSIAGELLNIQDVPTQPHEVIELIEEKLNHRGSPRIFIIVHNLDGIMLRTDKAQALLARLACIPKCSLLASIDHINAPLLWDDKKLSEFNFLWEDVTTYYMYLEETSFENSLLVQRSSSLALASLKNVYQSLTKNGKEIFKILLKDCLANKKNQKYFGLGFSDLYWRCRDNFLVSTDLALRSQLTEFLDHQIVKWRKDSEHLIIPIDASVLEQFQNLLQDAEF